MTPVDADEWSGETGNRSANAGDGAARATAATAKSDRIRLVSIFTLTVEIAPMLAITRTARQ